MADRRQPGGAGLMPAVPPPDRASTDISDRASTDVPDRASVVIVGGGIAGCAAALSLAQRGVRDVLVVEAGDNPAFRIGESIPPVSGVILRQLGLWEDFQAQGHEQSLGGAASWGKAELGHNDFLFDPHGPGWRLDRARFDAMAADKTAAAVPFLRGRKATAVARNDAGGYHLTLSAAGADDLRLTAGFVIDASGVAAGAVRRLGVARNEVDALVVVHAVYMLAEPDAVPARTLLEGAECGWWYAAKLPGGRMIVALTTDREEMRAQRLNEPAGWEMALRATRHVAALLERGGGERDAAATLLLAPVSTAILSRVVGPGWLATGDAACSYDPITAHGVLKALTDGVTAGQAVAAYLQTGDEAPLSAYQDGVFDRFTGYLNLRRHLYGLENRWPDAGFWRRRPL